MGERLELGPLELKVLEVLWERNRASTVRQVQPSFPQLAYTTLMTTLDRLYRKGVLRRLRLGRAFGYEPRCSRDQLFGRMVSGRVTELLAACGDSTVLLSTLVEAVGHADAELLDELEALVQAERARLKCEDDK
ncbi:MAG TPA: BlaI/MecI/CopY family transcriptional regulator [Steroidobacteraceae bacterium]|nr:BlaI/MecI/CopY family transcriptional regulator [Steroidobacteraceae bacterium]